ncbi:hypothetical protein BDQ12DRAFT_505590 [Crucibulum laeve]|uniref:Uncharacterized protein n=1 Tax=Crucibulum laeve TaxID=68775 RepID=A0A5C3LI56_9AGAR|nr:hypothetical protein BDQ12DRAFT_505590 [Crucibulum laeve]
MSPQRVADAANISPYPFTQQQGPSNTPASEDGVREPKSKKGKVTRPRPERNPRQEEEIRFNVGPRSFRNLTGGRGGRRSARAGRQDRTHLDGSIEPVPDYPPPTFMEAMSSPALPVATLGSMMTPVATLGAVLTSRPQPTQVVFPHGKTVLSAPQNEASSSVTPPAPSPQPFIEGTPRNTSPEPDSDDSLEIIDKTAAEGEPPSGVQLEEGVKRDWLNRRGVEFPTPSSTGDSYVSSRLDLSSDPPTRGRPVARSRGAIDLDPELPGEAQDEVAPLPTPKRRYLSLSPLRTLFPSRQLGLNDRALSAQPSPGSSPYSMSKTSFFRSTASLATSSFLRLPSFSSPAATAKGDNSLSRKLFSSKAKEPAREKEPLNTWEVLSIEREHPPSLMTAVESFTDSPRLATATSPGTRSQSFSCMSPTTESTKSPYALSLETTPDSPYDARQDDLLHATHPLSSRERRIVSTPFINRPVRRSGLSPSSSRVAVVDSVGGIAPMQAHAPDTGPPITTVRSRIAEPTQPLVYAKRGIPVANHASPLSVNVWRADPEDDSQALFQRALNTPLPITPVGHHVHFGSATASPSTPITRYGTPTDQIFSADIGIMIDSSSVTLDSDVSRNTVSPDHDASKRSLTSHQPSLTPSIPSSLQLPVPRRSPSPSLKEPMTPTRRHYPGRPLPRPPGPNRMLIDLDDTSLNGFSISGTSTPRSDERFRSQTYLPMTPSGSSTVDFLDSRPDTPIRSSSRADSPVQAISPGAASSLSGFSDVTDLDLLVSRLDEGARNGADYEVSHQKAEWPRSPLMLLSGPSPRRGVHRACDSDTGTCTCPPDTVQVDVHRKHQYMPHRAY